MGREGAISVLTVRTMARRGAGFAAGFIALGQIVGLLPSGAQPLRDASPLVMIEPATGAIDTSIDRQKRSAPVADAPAPSGNPLWSLPLTALPVTRDRPIFSPSRRPPPPPVVAAPYVPPPSPPPPTVPPEPDHPLLTLLGALAGESQGVGIFLDETDKTTLRLRTGEGHQGWVLMSIRGAEATFVKGERTATLALLPIGSAAQARASSIALGHTWRDGDGQMIKAPPARQSKPASPVAAPLRDTWLDGDGQMIGAPPKSQSAPAIAPTSVDPVM
jgi:hypothetical protein